MRAALAGMGCDDMPPNGMYVLGGLWTAVPTGSLRYGSEFILESMKIGERGQVTIPKDIRDRFGLGPDTEVDFTVAGGAIVIKKVSKPLGLEKWKGRCRKSFTELGYASVDDDSRQLGSATSRAGARCRQPKPADKRPAGATKREVASHIDDIRGR